MDLIYRKTFKACFLVFAFLLTSHAAHAQEGAGPCPEGMSQYSSPNGVPTCGPMINQTPARPVRWASQWGAIATDGPGGSFGAATNMPSKSQAEQAALADCRSKKGSTCKVEIAYYNQCAAMVIGDKMHNSGSAATVDKAVQLGVKVCNDDGDTNCRAYYTACSLPERIQ